MEKKLKAFEEVFKNHPILAIWEVDETGNKVGKFPVISFGRSKAEAITQLMTDIQTFVAKKA
jgi:hypothetical protein